MVEQLPFKEKVRGSNPLGGTKIMGQSNKTKIYHDFANHWIFFDWIFGMDFGSPENAGNLSKEGIVGFCFCNFRKFTLGIVALFFRC